MIYIMSGYGSIIPFALNTNPLNNINYEEIAEAFLVVGHGRYIFRM